MFIAPRRKPRIKTRMTYGLALAAMAATFSALQAYADDSMQPATDKPPQIAAPANNMAPPAPAVAPMGTTKVLGTLPAGGGQPTAVPPAPVPQASMPASVPAGTPAAAEVPLVAPIEPSMTSWEDVLPPQKAGDITYVTGGVGDEERAALGQAKKNFNLYVMSSNKDGTFIGDTHIVIRSSKGDELLNIAAGPLFYAKLPAGTYTIEGVKAGQTQKEKIKLGTKGASNVGFSW